MMPSSSSTLEIHDRAKSLCGGACALSLTVREADAVALTERWCCAGAVGWFACRFRRRKGRTVASESSSDELFPSRTGCVAWAPARLVVPGDEALDGSR